MMSPAPKHRKLEAATDVTTTADDTVLVLPKAQLTSLPYDILVLIAGSSDFHTLWALRQTCRLFFDLYHQPHAHQLILHSSGIEQLLPLPPPLRLLQHIASLHLIPSLPPLPSPHSTNAPPRLVDTHFTFLRTIKELILVALRRTLRPAVHTRYALRKWHGTMAAAVKYQGEFETQLPPPQAQVRAAWNFLLALLAPAVAEQLSVYELWELCFLHATPEGKNLERAWARELRRWAAAKREGGEEKRNDGDGDEEEEDREGENKTEQSEEPKFNWQSAWQQRFNKVHATVRAQLLPAPTTNAPQPPNIPMRARNYKALREVASAISHIKRFTESAIESDIDSYSLQLLPDVAPSIGRLSPKEAIWHPYDFTTEIDCRPDCRAYLGRYRDCFRRTVNLLQDRPYPPYARVIDVVEKVLGFLEEAFRDSPRVDYAPITPLGVSWNRRIIRPVE